MIFGFHSCLTAGRQRSRISLCVKPNKHGNVTGNKEPRAEKFMCRRTKVHGNIRKAGHRYNLHCGLEGHPHETIQNGNSMTQERTNAYMGISCPEEQKEELQ